MHVASLSVFLDHQEDFLYLLCTHIAVAQFTENQAHGLVAFFAHYLLYSLVVHKVHSTAKNRHTLAKKFALAHLL